MKTTYCKTCNKGFLYQDSYRRYYCSERCFNQQRKRACLRCGEHNFLANKNSPLCKKCFPLNNIDEKHPLYKIYLSMVYRCYNPKRNNYQHYGGKGIAVCERWLQNFQDFCKDLGERGHELTLDRIDNSKNYCPENCRWATVQEQRLNRGRFKGTKRKYKGVHRHGSGFVTTLRFNTENFYLGTFKTEIEAATAYNNKLKELLGDKCLDSYLNKF